MNIKEFFRAALFLTLLVIAMGAMETVLAGQYHSQPGYSKLACTPFQLHDYGAKLESGSCTTRVTPTG